MAEILEGELQVTRHENGRVEIVQAPQRTAISLEFLVSTERHLVRVSGSLLRFAGQVEYRVVGWDPVQHALIAERSS
jgi:hypothetical protein